MIKSFFVYLCMALMVCMTPVVEAGKAKGQRTQTYDESSFRYTSVQKHNTPNKENRKIRRCFEREWERAKNASTCKKASCVTTGVILIALAGSGLIYYALSSGDGDVPNHTTPSRGMTPPTMPGTRPCPFRTTPIRTTPIPIFSVSRKALPEIETTPPMTPPIPIPSEPRKNSRICDKDKDFKDSYENGFWRCNIDGVWTWISGSRLDPAPTPTQAPQRYHPRYDRGRSSFQSDFNGGIPYYTPPEKPTVAPPPPPECWLDIREEFRCAKDGYTYCWEEICSDGRNYETPARYLPNFNEGHTTFVACPQGTPSDAWCWSTDGTSVMMNPGYSQLTFQYVHNEKRQGEGAKMPADVQKICSEQVLLWKPQILGIKGSQTPYLMHFEIGTNLKKYNSVGGPSQFTKDGFVTLGNFWISENHFQDVRDRQVLCSHEAGHSWFAPENPLFNKSLIDIGNQTYFTGPRTMAFFGGPVPVNSGNYRGHHWEYNLKHAQTGAAISGSPMNDGHSTNWTIGEIHPCTLDDMGLLTPVSILTGRRQRSYDPL